MKKNTPKRVLVAMSGGVDSSVAVALLQRAGFDVFGVFMRFWKAPNEKKGGWNRCCSIDSEKRARAVAQKLGISFYTLNFSSEFKKRVVDYFLKEYKQGRTPNPCVVCNKEIKFGLLLEKALAFKADFIATGHYANTKCTKAGCKLFQSKNKDKDQSYFLWQLNQKQLKKILFPVGDYTKAQVREIAEEFGLPTAQTKESQEVCFIETTTADFLKKYLKQKPGPIREITSNGVHKIIGEHQGLWFYTIGQRKGIGLSGGPYYVLEKNIKTNTLIVTKNETEIEEKELLAKNVNWISGKSPKLPIKVKMKIRHSLELSSGQVIGEIKPGLYKVVFTKPQTAVASGQSVVFYNKNELLGGGIIC